MKKNDILKDLVKELDAIEIIEFKNYLIENLITFSVEKNSNSKIISNNKDKDLFCQKCGCKYNKNGKTKNGVQKYICSGCRSTCSETTDTITYHSKLSFEVWKNVIDNLLDGFSIRRIAEENDISNYTSFNLRHKVLFALKRFVNSLKLKGNAQSDEKYLTINLKGTKPENMPRFSKKRTSTKAPYNGISHHKVCVVSTVDEEDNLVLKIAGLGRCTTKMIEESIGDQIKEVKILTSQTVDK